MRRAEAESNVLPILGMVLLVPPVYFVTRWILIFHGTSGHDGRMAEFGSVLPGALSDPVASTLLAASCPALAAGFGAAGLIRLSGLRRRLSVATLGIGGLLSLWLAWSLL